ncbi:MFS transporter [Streptomyces solicathayae]|uniref:MFS transporter n=1 Tax=Streptomyces solicathayae TaxID=3081768 RepID=A0ABZ0M391_9ACTN|nr:MFS transporter [Streptomyces sp. HUAS YS2]WOX26242.1 MFS transporter [Streptomyces sp. HUAS YS2]
MPTPARTPSPTSAPPVPVLVLAVAGAVTVANLYFPQPLLDTVARGLDVSAQTAGIVAATGQFGYAAGLLFLAPLADLVDLRRLTTVLLALTCGGLLVAAAAPNAVTLVLATLAVSTTTVLPQILVPVGASLAGPERRGHVVGLIGLGLTLGSTLSRTVSGAVADASGSWRAAYVLSAALTGAVLLFLPRALPTRRPAPASPAPVSYGRLLAGLPGLLAAHREVRVAALLGASVFAAYSVFWAALSFHLAAPPLGLGAGAAGLFGLASVPAALLSAAAGRLADRHGPTVVNAWAFGCVAVSLAVMGLLPHAPAALAVGCNLLVLGTSASQVASQARVLAVGKESAARVNTVFMLASFGGGALGTLTASWLYGSYGWTATLLAAAAFLAIGAPALLRRARALDRPTARAGGRSSRSPVHVGGRVRGSVGLGVGADAAPVDGHARLVAEDPGVVSRLDVEEGAGGQLGGRAVVEDHLHAAADDVTDVMGHAALGADDRLDVLGPLPARLEDGPPHRSPVGDDQVHPALAVLEAAGLVRGVEGLADDSGHGHPPPAVRRTAPSPIPGYAGDGPAARPIWALCADSVAKFCTNLLRGRSTHKGQIRAQ